MAETIVRESLAYTCYEFSEEVYDATMQAEGEVLGTSRKALVMSNCDMRIIETHYFNTQTFLDTAIKWARENGYETYVVGADVLEPANV